MKVSKEFEKELPKTTTCNECGKLLTVRGWKVGRCPEGEVALSVVLCTCGVYSMAAAGSSEGAWRHAQEVRSLWIASWVGRTSTYLQ